MRELGGARGACEGKESFEDMPTVEVGQRQQVKTAEPEVIKPEQREEGHHRSGRFVYRGKV
jgi:hypothetical protein